MRDLRRGLLVPAFLGVTALAPACGDDKPPSTETGTTDTTGATATDDTAPTTTAGTTGEPFPDCAVLPDMAACEAVSACVWDGFAGVCVPDCPQIDDRPTCVNTDFCEWFDDVCQQPI